MEEDLKGSMWSIKQDYHASGAIAVWEKDGTPVLVAHTGRYPQAVADDGRSTRYVPHVLISIGGCSIDGVQFFSGVTVHAVGPWQGGRRRELVVFSAPADGGSRLDTTPDQWVAMGGSKIVDAVGVLASIGETFGAADAIVARAWSYQSPLSRGEYEAACDSLGVQALPDSECLGYGVKYGEFSFPEYAAEVVAKMYLAQLRLAQVEAERVAADNPTRLVQPAATRHIERSGQLWEACERCGAEPVYMPLHLCKSCWPK